MLAALLIFALRQRFAVLLLTMAIVFAGGWAFQQLKVEAYPDISETQVLVITLAPGQAAEEIEQQITVPIERALQSVPRVTARRSRTIFGLSVVDLTFEYGTEDSIARQAVLERLRDAEVPEGIVPGLAPPTTPAGELYRYIVQSDRLDEIERREIQDWIIAPRLLQVPGVGDVFAFGGLVKQYQIEVDPQALNRYGLTIQRIAEAIDANNQNAGGALVSNGQQAMVVRGVGLIRSVGDLQRVMVASENGVPVFVRDIGTVRIGAAPRTGIFGLNQRDDEVEGVVAMRRGDNPSEVLRGVKAAVDELNVTLPEGARIVPIYDRTELVSQTLRTVSRTLTEGLVVVAGVLLLLLCSPRAAFLATLTIPLSLLFAFLCMHLTGIPANLLSLGALDLGIIVDGTLVMVIHITRSLVARREPAQDPHDVLRNAAAAMEKPLFVAMAIIIAAYVPLFGLERMERRLFTPMAYTICYALLGSLLFTMTFVPAMASYMFGTRPVHRLNPAMIWLQERYSRLVRFSVRRSWWVASSCGLLAFGAFFLGRSLGTEFLPQLDEGVIWVRAHLPAGAAIEQSAEVAGRIRDLIRRHPEVELVSSQTGRQDSNTEPFGPNRIELLVALKPYEGWSNHRPKAALIEELAAELKTHIPGVAFSFTQPIIDMVTESVTGSSADLAIIYTGSDLSELRGLAAQALALVRQIRGSADSAIEQDADQSQLQILIDREAVARYGINVADVQDVIELAIGGRAVSTLYAGDRRFDITVRYEPSARGTVDSIRNLMLTTPAGLRIPLNELARVLVQSGASIVARRENRRQVSVRTNIRGRDQGGFVSEAQRLIAAEMVLPAGFRIEWGGQFENLSRAGRRLRVILPLTILLMFGLLYAAFESTVDASLVLLNVPFAMIGGITALYLRGIPLSVSAAVGFVSVFGVAVMTGVLFIAEVNRRRLTAGSAVEDAIVDAASARMVSNLMLILVAMFGIVPAAVASGIGSDIQRPMATVIVGGLVSTLVLALVAMPSLYWLVSRNRRPSKPLLLEH